MHPLSLGTVLAQAANGGRAANFFFLIAIVVVFYLMLVRPQQRRAKQHQELVKSIGTGDRVVTIGGIHGTVESMDEDTVRVEIAAGTVITMARTALARRVVDADSGDQPPADTTPDTSGTA